jgi:hypothetical protein
MRFEAESWVVPARPMAPTKSQLNRKNDRSRALCAVLVLRRGHVLLLIPKPQYSFLNLSFEIVGQVNDGAVSPSALVRLIRSLWHLNEGLLAFRLNDPYVQIRIPLTFTVAKPRREPRSSFRISSTRMVIALASCASNIHRVEALSVLCAHTSDD